MPPHFHHHCDCECHRPQYIVLFSGDDSNFVGNNKIFIELETELDTTGCRAHIKYIGKTFTWETIPEDKRLELVFSAEETKAMPLGDWDAELWLEDAQSRRRTVSNRIRIRVTKSVEDAYRGEGPQYIRTSIGSEFDYNNAYNKPSINGVELVGNKSLDSLGVQAKLPTTEYDTYDITVTMADRAASDLYGRAIATTYAKIQDVYDKSEVDGKLANMVTKDGVVPKGDGTEVIATIGGKDIKAPASPVSSVNGKMGEVKLVAQDVGAFPASGGEVGSDESAGVIRLAATYFDAPVLEFKQSFASAAALNIPNSAMYEQTGEGPMASIKKGGKEVATEEQLTPISAQSAYPMSTVVDGALKDRTVNHATAGGTFNFPARTGTNARDFVLVIDALSTAPTVTFPGSFTYVSEQDAADIWTAEADKVNSWYFSEVADGVFMVCHKAMGSVAQ